MLHMAKETHPLVYNPYKIWTQSYISGHSQEMLRDITG